jgi:hypothetical protein
MRMGTLIAFILFIIIFIAGQEIQEDAIAINIEVPVRVYDGNEFVENLSIEDFEIYEDGVPQNVEAVYLIKKTGIQKKEGERTIEPKTKTFRPETNRNFYLLFEIVEYSPRLEEAISYFCQNVLAPGDSLTIVTPMKTIAMKSNALSKVSENEVAEQLCKILKKDAWIGNAEYKHIIFELKTFVRAMSEVGARRVDEYSSIGTEIQTLERYEDILSRLESLRNVDQKRILDFADFIKDKPGQKHVFLFYQREFIPQLKPEDFDRLTSSSDPYTQLKVSHLFGYFFRDISLNVDKVKQIFSDSSITINFLFFTKPAEHIAGVQMVEHSEDIFNAFREMSRATGGITSSSANPAFLFQRASDAVEHYYLLYYSPKAYRADGKFKNIKVKVKGKNYRITHRAGYIAD